MTRTAPEDAILHTLALDQDFETREQDGDLIVEGYAVKWMTPELLYTVAGVNVYEQVARGTWNQKARKRTVYLRGHEWSGHVYAARPASTLAVDEDDTGLVTTVRLDPRQTAAQDLWASIDRGDVSGQSVGFSVRGAYKETAEKLENGDRLYTIQKSAVLHEVSAVWNPAYKSTTLGTRQLTLRRDLRSEGAATRIDQDQQDVRSPDRTDTTKRARIGRARIALARAGAR